MSDSRPSDCTHCSKPVHLHLSKVIDGEVTKIGVCKDCAHAKAYLESNGFDLIEGGKGVEKLKLPASSKVSCPSCGLTPADFKESGRLGCPSCYEVYAEKLEPLYRKLHKGASHLGKSPKGQKRQVTFEELDALRKRMEEHVSREEYELAAVVRDQIKSLES